MYKYNTLIFILALLLVAGCSGNQQEIKKLSDQIYSNKVWSDPLPPNKFKSDGCSCWFDGDWVACCVEHDLAYWMGGTRQERKEADIELKKCVAERGHPIVATIMYYGVRIGGVYWLPTPFRWGFGWDYPQSGPPNKPY